MLKKEVERRREGGLYSDKLFAGAGISSYAIAHGASLPN